MLIYIAYTACIEVCNTDSQGHLFESTMSSQQLLPLKQIKEYSRYTKMNLLSCYFSRVIKILSSLRLFGTARNIQNARLNRTDMEIFCTVLRILHFSSLDNSYCHIGMASSMRRESKHCGILNVFKSNSTWVMCCNCQDFLSFSSDIQCSFYLTQW